jgi:hypothetical protein
MVIKKLTVTKRKRVPAYMREQPERVAAAKKLPVMDYIAFSKLAKEKDYLYSEIIRYDIPNYAGDVSNSVHYFCKIGKTNCPYSGGKMMHKKCPHVLAYRGK